jgi:ribonuclease Z
MKLTITGYSTALFSTWYFIEELGILFDAGEGLSSALLQKSRKINQVFISHADRDHLTGLLQFNQLNAREGLPVIHFPKDSGSFPALEGFSKKFDPHVSGTVWKPVSEETPVWIKDDIVVEAIVNGHVAAEKGRVKSLSYKVVQVKKKLKPELVKLGGLEIKKIIEERGEENTHTEHRKNILSYSGDTPVEDPQRWDHSGILIHEATFLDTGEKQGLHTHGNKHSRLEEVMEMVSGIHIEKLVLGHFSSRYAPELIDRGIKELCDKYAISIPVYCVLPGETVKDILSGKPINQ